MPKVLPMSLYFVVTYVYKPYQKAIFSYFFWRLQKSMASGGTRPAGLDFNGGELLRVAGNFLPSAEWAGINVGRFCLGGDEGERRSRGLSIFSTAAGSRRVAVCCLEVRGKWGRGPVLMTMNNEISVSYSCRIDKMTTSPDLSQSQLLPTLSGQVVAACVKPELNPRAPYVILCGKGPIIASAGALLARQHDPIPVFIKRGTNRWEYQGKFKVTASYFSGSQFTALIADSGRSLSDVSLAIELSQSLT